MGVRMCAVDERFISWVDFNCSAMIRFPIICSSYCFVFFVSQHFCFKTSLSFSFQFIMNETDAHLKDKVYKVFDC